MRRSDRPRVGKYPLLALPALDYSLGAPRGPVELAELHFGKSDPCDLAIAGSEVLLGGGARFETQLRSQPGNEPRVWEVVERVAQTLGAPPSVGRFTLADGKLLFEWSSFREAGGHPHLLPYCLLLINVADEQELCALGAPARAEPITLNLDYVRHSQPIALGAGAGAELPQGADPLLRLELWTEAPADLPVLVVPDQPLTVRSETGTPAAILIGKPQGALKRECVELRANFARVNGRLQVLLETFMFPAQIKDENFRALPWRFVAEEASSGMSFNAADLESQQQRAAGFLKTLKRLESQPDREISELTREIRSGEDLMRKLSQQLQQVSAQGKQTLERSLNTQRAELDRHQNQLARWSQSRDALQQAIDFGQANLEWCHRLDALLDRIQAEVRIGYRVYLVPDSGGEIEIVRTRGAVDRDPLDGGVSGN